MISRRLQLVTILSGYQTCNEYDIQDQHGKVSYRKRCVSCVDGQRMCCTQVIGSIKEVSPMYSRLVCGVVWCGVVCDCVCVCVCRCSSGTEHLRHMCMTVQGGHYSS